MGGREGERAEAAKVPAIRRIVGKQVEGGTAFETRPFASFQTAF